MKIEHIVWEDWNYTDKKVFGILEIEVHWHGGGTDKFIMEGTYSNKDRGLFTNRIMGTLSSDTEGVSNVSLLRIGTIAE
jgi:hypothetical protein